MPFRHKETVEVCHRRTGFVADAYYLRATFMAAMGGTHSLVQYETRYTDEAMTTLKTEIVDDDFLRPVPPSPSNRTDYAVSQKVDAYDDGAWWVGRISAVHDNQSPAEAPELSVRLDTNGGVYRFPFFRLRNHLDWRNGEWVQPGPSRAYVTLKRLPLSCRS
ncbi:hypothetical protein L484_005786 [Morus notabilis]|uniref:Agenet-like domain-containing protein n=1 Tax=Morus notabilis TaxID=981085 RepID=W9RJQ9_9ROSA|nr:DUF724 domain-containing protein 2 [Morus notabilis]EXB94629.1 hypothetical protein L484_005786 [Morus notabilis]